MLLISSLVCVCYVRTCTFLAMCKFAETTVTKTNLAELSISPLLFFYALCAP